MTGLENLAGFISHELNNIQSAMLLGIQLLERENFTSNDGKMHLATFKKVSERIQNYLVT